MRFPVLLAGLLACAAPAAAQSPAKMGVTDYAKPESWLCRPDANGPCDTDLSLTDISPAGARILPPPPATEQRIDCFYVYPTVSPQPTSNADGTLTDDEVYVVQQQFARFGEVCRRFAPLYRQTTLASIRGTVAPDHELAYADVLAAWNHYLAHDNKGRGVLLIGHSQGARHLKRLVSEQVSGKPVQQHLVAAYVIGTNVSLPQGRTSGGDLGSIPLCTSATHTGCAVAYVSFSEAGPPGAEARFGRAAPGQAIACTNPAELIGAPNLTGIFPSRPREAGSSGTALTFTETPPTTAAYQLSGLITARCAQDGNASWLAVDSKAPRIRAAFQRIDGTLPGWGLHVVDINLAQGSLIELAKRQTNAWLGSAGTGR